MLIKPSCPATLHRLYRFAACSVQRNRPGWVLGLIASITAGAIALTQLCTAPTIRIQTQAYQTALLQELVQHAGPDIALVQAAQPLFAPSPPCPQYTQLDRLRPTEASQWYRALRQQRTEVVILPTTTAVAYTDAIRLWVAVDRSGQVLGVRVISHRETPGLGDQIELSKSSWITRFNGTSLTQPEPPYWQVRTQGGAFDQLTGATITSRAVVQGVYHALLFFAANQRTLLQPSVCVTTHTPSLKG